LSRDNSGAFPSVQPELALNEAELLRGDQPPMADANPIERPIKIGGPEIQPEPMAMWPISTRVNTPDNDEPSLLKQVDEIAY
jgi:hypothetical protein